jgi:hypothetical protein
MSRLKTQPSARSFSSDDVTLAEALERVDNPRLAASLSVFYAELARAQTDDDREGADYARRAIAEAMRGVPHQGIDRPLMPLLRKRGKKRRR